MGCRKWSRICIWLLLMVLCAGTPEAPAGGKGLKARKGAPGAVQRDYVVFLGELEAGGALSFYDNTEDILRLAQFERALMRYRFLKGQVQGSVDYRGLVVQIDRRLRFLKKQLHLSEFEVAAIPPRRIRRPKPPAATTPPESKPTPPSAAKPKPKEEDIITTDTPRGLTPPPPEEKTKVIGMPPVIVDIERPGEKPPDKEQGDKPKEDKPKGDKEAAQADKPESPKSIWEKLRKRLHLGKKAAVEPKTE